MVLPTISEHELRAHFPNVDELEEPIQGGQKLGCGLN